MDPLLEVRGLEKRFGGNRAVDGATFEVLPRSITGLIGPNGAGKTTCFNCIAGALKPDGGHVVFDGEEITGMPSYRVYERGLARTFQIPQELGGMSVLENLMLAPHGQRGERIWESLFRPGRVAAEERRNVIRAQEVLKRVDLGDAAGERSDSLSGGQRKLLELARVLMGRPRMILLDEPSAGVNPMLMMRQPAWGHCASHRRAQQVPLTARPADRRTRRPSASLPPHLRHLLHPCRRARSGRPAAARP